MPNSYIETYFPLLFQVLFAIIAGGALLGISLFVGRRLRNRVKDDPYECGISPTGSARERFSVKFYLVAMLFILFDIEAIFLYPWAVVFRDLGFYGFVVMLLFLDLVLWGFYYLWKKGVLNWAQDELTPHTRPRP